MRRVRAPYPKRPADRFVVLVDHDGTLVTRRKAEGRYPYLDPERRRRELMAHQVVVDYVQVLAAAGYEIRHTSGAHPSMWDIIVEELHGLGFKDAHDRLQLHGFESVDQLAADKACEALDWDAVAIIGDRRDIEGRAAEMAGIAWISIKDIVQGKSLDGLWCWICGTPASRFPAGTTWTSGRACSTCTAATCRPHDAQLEVLA